MDPAELRALDEIAADGTPSPFEVDVAGWWCKAAPELPFRRANVARPPLGVGGDGAAARAGLTQVRAWYAGHGQRTIVQVSSADPEAAPLDEVLAGEGLVLEAPVYVMVAPIAPVEPAGVEPDSIDVHVGMDEAWARSHAVLDGGGAEQAQRAMAYGRMLEDRGDRALAATARTVAGATVGVGLGVVDRGWLGIFAMGTSPDHRRQGIASRLVRALTSAASQRGATRAYLQVETDNAGAIACYQRLGFTISHGYHYRSEGTDPDQGC